MMKARWVATSRRDHQYNPPTRRSRQQLTISTVKARAEANEARSAKTNDASDERHVVAGDRKAAAERLRYVIALVT